MNNFRTIDRQTGFLLPPSVDEWLPEKHLARFVVEVIDGMDLRAMSGSYRGSGSASYHPRMLLGILVYGYATGVFSSRKLERATYDSVAFRFIAANDHPDHDTIAAFRRRFLKRGAVRSGAAVGARDGRSENGDDWARRHENPRQRQSTQRAFLSTCGQDRGATEGGSRRSHGQSRGGGRGGHCRWHVDSRRTGAARRAFAQDRRSACEDRSARQGTPCARASGA